MGEQQTRPRPFPSRELLCQKSEDGGGFGGGRKKRRNFGGDSLRFPEKWRRRRMVRNFFFGGVWDSPVSVFFLQNRYQKTPVPQIFGRKCTLEEKDHFCSVQSYGNFLALEKRPLFSVPIRGGEMSADGKFNCAYVADWEEGGTSSWETVSWTGIRKKGEIRTLNFERARRITHSPLPTTHTTCGKQFEVVLGNKKAFWCWPLFPTKKMEKGSRFSVSNSPVSHTFMLAVYSIYIELEKNKYMAEQASIPFSSRIREIRDFFPSFTKPPPPSRGYNAEQTAEPKNHHWRRRRRRRRSASPPCWLRLKSRLGTQIQRVWHKTRPKVPFLHSKDLTLVL